jgi:ATP-dependent helicase/nuclease subunit B
MEGRLKGMLGTKSIECMALLYLSIEKTDVKLELDGLYKSEYKKALGITKKGDIRSDNFMELIEYIKSLMLETIALIKSGKFNYKPMCSSLEGYVAYPCEYVGLCRYSRNKVRILGGEGHEK